jgi:hypothetical protein
MSTYNIYIDESCHLQNDGCEVMCLGYTKLAKEDYLGLSSAIKTLKLNHRSPTEIKWNKVSLSRMPLYKALIDFFFAAPIDFRCVLIKNKSILDHDQFNQGDQNNFYYKTVYLLLNKSNPPDDYKYNVLLDYKDTRGSERLKKIKEVFQNQYHGQSPFSSFQHIHSHDNELLQLTDFFIGAITYKSRMEMLQVKSPVKLEIIEYLESKSGYELNKGTEPWETKFNIFDFQPRKSVHGT